MPGNKGSLLFGFTRVSMIFKKWIVAALSKITSFGNSAFYFPSEIILRGKNYHKE
ncbi:hypothetical protein MUO65_00570 [bacterium]|nr:hypothetical protein [bacterium]